MNYIRKPVVAGAFYPSDAAQLKKQILGFLEKAGSPQLQGAHAFVVPHAGYVYSGPIAACSYAAIKEIQPELVIVLAPSHSARFEGASVIPSGSYETPLGQVRIDENTGRALESEQHFAFVPGVHEAEHSLEVQVPFLQCILNDFTLVPVIIGTHDVSILEEIAKTIYKQIAGDKRKVTVVISTDLSHYHSDEKARQIDTEFITALESFDYNKVSSVCSEGRGEACGEGPVIAGMMLAEKMGARTVQTLCYGTSGDVSGDKTQVVGYVSAALV